MIDTELPFPYNKDTQFFRTSIVKNRERAEGTNGVFRLLWLPSQLTPRMNGEMVPGFDILS
jgi:hypothetical protein